VGLAAGLVGYARLATWLRDRRHGRWLLAAVWVATAAGLLVADSAIQKRFANIEYPISKTEAAEIWRWVGRVGPRDAVLACYEVCAPLSSRKRLYSYVLKSNEPKGYPELDSDFHWAFMKNGVSTPKTFTDQGFERVFEGTFLSIYHRDGNNGSANSEKESEQREHFR
jgi:hypothetical protein